jgi:hypothetical protein
MTLTFIMTASPHSTLTVHQAYLADIQKRVSSLIASAISSHVGKQEDGPT